MTRTEYAHLMLRELQESYHKAAQPFIDILVQDAAMSTSPHAIMVSREEYARFCAMPDTTLNLDSATIGNDSVREEFEAWIKSPPFEHMCDRYDENGAWKGDYKRYETQLAFEAWQASKERCQPKDCAWTYDDDSESYDTQCGQLFTIIEGTPDENHMAFCAYCGGHLVATPTGGNEK